MSRPRRHSPGGMVFHVLNRGVGRRVLFTNGRKGPPTVPWCQKVGGPFRSTLSASGHERMVNGRVEASGEKRMDLSEEIAWFGNMLNLGDILTERDRSSRSGPVRSFAIRMSVDGSSQRGKVCARPEPAGVAWSVRRGEGEQWHGNSGQWPVVSGTGTVASNQ